MIWSELLSDQQYAYVHLKNKIRISDELLVTLVEPWFTDLADW